MRPSAPAFWFRGIQLKGDMSLAQFHRDKAIKDGEVIVVSFDIVLPFMYYDQEL